MTNIYPNYFDQTKEWLCAALPYFLTKVGEVFYKKTYFLLTMAK